MYYGDQLKEMTSNCRVFVNEKTFEYDLALESHRNAKIMLEIILDRLSTDGPIKKQAEQYIRDMHWNYYSTFLSKKMLQDLKNF